MYNVLIVDDEKIEREGIRFLLSREEGDFHILEASNGKQALNVLRSENIDLLLTDIKIRTWTGWNFRSVQRKKMRNCRS